MTANEKAITTRSIRRFSFLSAILGFSFLLLVSPVGASPALSLSPQSTAQYQLLASYRTVQSCTASPANYTFLGCGPGSNPASGPPLVIGVEDDGKCSNADPNCKFAPANVTISVGGTIEWYDTGKLNHTITFTSNQIAAFSLFAVNSTNGYPFLLSRSGYRTFEIAGNYSYNDGSFTWMRGTVEVRALVPSPPTIQETNATGSVGWTVIGLDQRADLSFSHALTITSNSTGSTRTSANESGIFEDTIDLSTREETPGLGSQFGYLPSVFPIQWLTFPGQAYSPGNYYPPSYYPSPDVYAIWWVNGPLQDGSTVQLLTSVASVRGSESFGLPAGDLVKLIPAWILSSQFVEAYNQTQPTSSSSSPSIGPFPVGPSPSPIYYTAGSSSTVSITLDYGQKSDLLFAANSSLSNYNKQVTVYPNGSYINPYNPYNYGYYSYPIRVGQNVSVSNTYETVVSLSLTLKNTNLDLSQRMVIPATNSGSNPSPGAQPQNTANAQSTMPMWEYLAISTVGAAGVGAALVWIGLRLRKRPPNSATQPGAPLISV